MANTCEWEMKVVGKTKESLRRIVDILLYRDPEFCLYRCRQNDFHDWEKEFAPEKDEESGLWYVDLEGEVAWTCAGWFERRESCFYGEKVEGGSGTFSIFQDICKALNIGVELYAADIDDYRQEHHAVNHLGELVVEEYAEFNPQMPTDEELDSAECDLIDYWLPWIWGWPGYGDYKSVEAIFGNSEEANKSEAEL